MSRLVPSHHLHQFHIYPIVGADIIPAYASREAIAARFIALWRKGNLIKSSRHRLNSMFWNLSFDASVARDCGENFRELRV
jgi:hypothetical protein